MTATSIIIHANGEKISSSITFYQESAQNPEFVSLQIDVGKDNVSIFMGLDQAREFLKQLQKLEINIEDRKEKANEE